MRFLIKQESHLMLKNLDIKKRLYFLLSFFCKFFVINNFNISF